MFRRTLFGDLPLDRWWTVTNAERNFPSGELSRCAVFLRLR